MLRCASAGSEDSIERVKSKGFKTASTMRFNSPVFCWHHIFFALDRPYHLFSTHSQVMRGRCYCLLLRVKSVAECIATLAKVCLLLCILWNCENSTIPSTPVLAECVTGWLNTSSCHRGPAAQITPWNVRTYISLQLVTVSIFIYKIGIPWNSRNYTAEKPYPTSFNSCIIHSYFLYILL